MMKTKIMMAAWVAVLGFAAGGIRAGESPATRGAAEAPSGSVASPAVTAGDRVSTGVASPAVALEVQTIAIAPRCVASTIGIVVREEKQNATTIADGSGVVVSADGLILTAGHVADKSGTPLTLRFPDGKVVKGVSLGVDRETDTGMARITDAAPQGGWAFSPIAPADSAHVGDWVLATGNPGSIVVGRNPPVRLGRVIGHDTNAVESNCDIQPGDSGGPLFDLQGRVVGINSRIGMIGTDPEHGSVYQSLHVPIALYSAHWDDLVAGKDAHLGSSIVGMPRHRHRPDFSRLDEALKKLLAAKDPEATKLFADAKKNGGRMALNEDETAKLIRRANLPARISAPAATAPTTQNSDTAGKANEPASPGPDFSRIGEALSKLAAANDPEAIKLLDDAKNNGGKMDLNANAVGKLLKKADLPPRDKPVISKAPTTAEAVAQGVPSAIRPLVRPQLKDTLHRQFPNAKISDETIERILDKSSFDTATGHLNVAPDAEDLKAMGVSPEAMVAHAGGQRHSRRAQELGRTSLQTLSLFAPGLDAAGDCVVEIRSGDKAVLLGTIVDADGWIVTKASDLPEHPTVMLPNGKIRDARVVGKDDATDLALLKVDARGLTAVKFADAAPLGEWLASPMGDPNLPAVGIVSVAARPIPETFAHFAGEQKIILGLGFTGKSCVVGQISEHMPAEKAGIKVGDEILELNGQPVSDPRDFVAQIKKAKPGDSLTVKARRDGKEMEFTPILGQSKMTTETSNGIGEVDNIAGGKLSKRRTRFPMAIQHDTELGADQCGGPLLNLAGETVGINIARYDHVCSFAIPADLVQETVAKLRK